MILQKEFVKSQQQITNLQRSCFTKVSTFTVSNHKDNLESKFHLKGTNGWDEMIRRLFTSSGPRIHAMMIIDKYLLKTRCPNEYLWSSSSVITDAVSPLPLIPSGSSHCLGKVLSGVSVGVLGWSDEIPLCGLLESFVGKCSGRLPLRVVQFRDGHQNFEHVARDELLGDLAVGRHHVRDDVDATVLDVGKVVGGKALKDLEPLLRTL